MAKRAALAHALNQALACAVVEQESSWDPWSIRYEPDFRSRYVAPLGLPPTVEIARSISWGLMQIMGQTARDLGYAGPMAQLLEPETGLDWGCRKLAQCFQLANGDPEAALLHWNGGADTTYPAQVLARTQKYEG